MSVVAKFEGDWIEKIEGAKEKRTSEGQNVLFGLARDGLNESAVAAQGGL